MKTINFTYLKIYQDNSDIKKVQSGLGDIDIFTYHYRCVIVYLLVYTIYFNIKT